MMLHKFIHRTRICLGTQLLICLLLGMTFSGEICAQKSKFPVYSDLAIPKPSGLPQFKTTDFKINQERLTLYPKGFLYGGKQTLEKLCNFLLNDPEGRVLWAKEAQNAAEVLNNWDFDRSGFGTDRYVYRMSQLGNLSMVYLFSGQKHLGQFIHGHVMQMAELPYEFWLHAELRGYDPERPKGGLETSSLCTTLAMTLSATGDLYSLAEKTKIDKVLHDKGLVPCLNWLEKVGVNNWTAVVSTGAYVAAKYFGEKEAMAIAMKAIAGFLNGSVEADGSYGEGVGYFNYPVKSLLPAILVMNEAERKKNFENSGLRHSAVWEAYPYLYSTKPDGQIKPTILHFGDNSYLGDNSFIGPTEQKVNLIIAALYKDPLAAWLIDKFKGSFDFLGRLMLFSIPEGLPEPQSPDQLKLPLVKAFDGGESYIRSTWAENGIVMSMWSGDGSRCRFSHQRPELGSICLGAYGEYLIVSAGSASYRSPLHYLWDRTTRAANTITIDDKNQLFPGSGQSSWIKTDVSDFWMTGTPKAKIEQCKTGEIADLLVNELAQAYHVPMKQLRRSVLFVRDPGYFVVVDNIDATNGSHKYTWRIHLNNSDDRGIIKEIGSGHWSFTRQFAGLDIHLFADRLLDTSVGQGYLHGSTRDYSPGGPNEGKLGSSVELEAHNQQNTSSMIYYAVFYPVGNGVVAPKVDYSPGKIRIGNDKLTFSGRQCVVESNGRSETFELWK